MEEEQVARKSSDGDLQDPLYIESDVFDIEEINYSSQSLTTDAKLDNLTNLKDHKYASCKPVDVRTGEEKLICKRCNVKFHHPRELNNHMRTHANKRLFKCNYCKKTFNRPGKLATHKLIHNREPLKCEICSKLFKRSADLLNHRRTHTEKQVYECHICSRVYYQRRYIVDHLRKHADDKFENCVRCGAEILCTNSSDSAVTVACGACSYVNRKWHGKKIGYKCSICNEIYSNKKEIKSHISEHKKYYFAKDVYYTMVTDQDLKKPPNEIGDTNSEKISKSCDLEFKRQDQDMGLTNSIKMIPLNSETGNYQNNLNQLIKQNHENIKKNFQTNTVLILKSLGSGSNQTLHLLPIKLMPNNNVATHVPQAAVENEKKLFNETLTMGSWQQSPMENCTNYDAPDRIIPEIDLIDEQSLDPDPLSDVIFMNDPYLYDRDDTNDIFSDMDMTDVTLFAENSDPLATDNSQDNTIGVDPFFMDSQRGQNVFKKIKLQANFSENKSESVD